MGLFDFFKRKAVSGNSVNNRKCYTESNLTNSEKSLLSEISKINASGRQISPELYQQLRDFEMNWLERNYDFNTIDGVNSIPVSSNVPGAPAPDSSVKGHTGEVYYYLRHKAYKHEECGDVELALACMRKSVELVMCRSYFTPDDCYPLVRMLARSGYIDEAREKKKFFDKVFRTKDEEDIIEYEYQKHVDSCTVKWLQEHFPSKAPKNVTGYRRMKTQNTKNFQVLKQLAAELGREI